MTKALVTPYNIGDRVLVTADVEDGPYAGDTGVIRRVVISDPNDGDDTFLIFYAKLASGGTCILGAEDMAPIISEADAWLRRQLDTLDSR